MRSQLLCTFTQTAQVPACVGSIHKAYDGEVTNLKSYSYVANMRNAICIYNVFTSERKVKDTISINCKKETTTFYSINGLNAIIRLMNNGILDKTYVINWSDYINCLILSEGPDNFKTILIEELLF